jgi:hypothetical protein
MDGASRHAGGGLLLFAGHERVEIARKMFAKLGAATDVSFQSGHC